jgi:restriction system protein
MDGIQFEEFLIFLFTKLGYSVRKTKTGNEQGADFILYTGYDSIAVQAKRWNRKVGKKAIQEIFTAKKYYNCKYAWVITNNFFTKPAKDLAKKCKVELFDRNGLIQIINKATRY